MAVMKDLGQFVEGVHTGGGGNDVGVNNLAELRQGLAVASTAEGGRVDDRPDRPCSYPPQFGHDVATQRRPARHDARVRLVTSDLLVSEREASVVDPNRVL